MLPGLTLLLDVQHQHREYDFLQQEVAHFTGEERNAYGVAYDFFNPKGGLFWQTPWRVAGGEIGLFAHAGITHREPADAEYWDTWYGPDDLGADPLFADRREVRDAAGNVAYVQWSDPLVEPERVVDWEGGLAVRARKLSFTLNGYWMDFANEIVPERLLRPRPRRPARQRRPDPAPRPRAGPALAARRRPRPVPRREPQLE